MAKKVDYTGQVRGRLTVLGRAGRHPKYGWSLWKVLCICGTEKVLTVAKVKSTSSCGCLRRELSAVRKTVPPDADGRYTCKHCGKGKVLDDMLSPRVCLACQKAKQAKYQKDNADKVKTNSRAWAKANPERVRENNRKWRQANFARYLLNTARSRALRKGLDFTITLEDLVIPEVCPVLGIPLHTTRGLKTRGFPMGHTPTVDRIDNTKGYIPGNVAIISWRANALKKDATAEEVEKLLVWMRSQERRHAQN